MAQCANAWQPTGGDAGVLTGAMAMTTWDPDGGGPQPECIVVGGEFRVAGNQIVDNIALWHPQTASWHAIGGGLPSLGLGGNPPTSTVLALAVLPNGELIAAGRLGTVGNIARWNGGSWSSLAGGMDGTVNGLTVLANGTLVAVGDFSHAGGVACSHIAAWTGTAWSPVGGGLSGGGGAYACLARQNGDLVVTGSFTAAGSIVARGIASWNGTTWSPLGAGLAFLPIGWDAAHAIVEWNGDLVIGGSSFTPTTSAPLLRRWDGTAWTSLGAPLTGWSVSGLTVTANGQLAVCGDFTLTGTPAATGFATFDGTNWSSLGGGLTAAGVACRELTGVGLVVAGRFPQIAGQQAGGMARWNGSQWVPLGAPHANWDSPARAFAQLPNGDLVAGGDFTFAAGSPCSRIARRTGSTWTPLGSGMNGSVCSLAVLPNGDLVAGGTFTQAGGTAVQNIARWDGAAWHAMHIGLPGGVSALAVRPDGELLASCWVPSFGPFQVRRWTGSSWVQVGQALNSWVHTIAVTTNGEVFIGGSFSSPPGVARLSNGVWSPVGPGLPGNVHGLAALPDGRLVAGGSFSIHPLLRLAIWNGATWNPMGNAPNGLVDAVATLPDGSVVAGGRFTAPGPNIARWNGTSWGSLGAGVDDTVFALGFDPEGGIIAGGAFRSAGSVPSIHVARFLTNCPAMTSLHAGGCASSAGPGLWSVGMHAWLGSNYTVDWSNLPANCLLVDVLGFASNPQPLAGVLPQGQAGCLLVPTPDVLRLLPVVSGAARARTMIPTTAALVGASFFHQGVPFEVDAAMSIVAVTATDTLRATIGAY